MARTLTKKEKGFANDYMETGNGTLAIKENYDVANDNVAAVMASRNLRKDKIQEYIADHAEDAEAMIYKLSQEATQEAIRLSASKDILDRAGFKPVEKTENTTVNLNILADLDNARLEKLIEEESAS